MRFSIVYAAVAATLLASTDAQAQNLCDGVTVVKNVKDLTKQEKQEIVAALVQMKRMNSTYDPAVSAYDYFPRCHKELLPKSLMHTGWGFFPWHRELNHRFTSELKRASVAAGGSVKYFPYWNFTNADDMELWLSDLEYIGGRGEKQSMYKMMEGALGGQKGDFPVNPAPPISTLPQEASDKVLVRAVGNGLQMCIDAQNRYFFLDTFVNPPDVDKQPKVGPFVFLPQDGPPDPSVVLFLAPDSANLQCSWTDASCERKYMDNQTALTCRHYAGSLPSPVDLQKCFKIVKLSASQSQQGDPYPDTSADPTIKSSWTSSKGYNLSSPTEYFSACIEGVDPSDRFAAGIERLGATLHSVHGRVHTYLGGSVATPSAANDPTFFHIHMNVDRLWAEWQQKNGDSYWLTGEGKGYLNVTLPVFKNPEVSAAQLLDHVKMGYAFDTQCIPSVISAPTPASVPTPPAATGVSGAQSVKSFPIEIAFLASLATYLLNFRV